MRRSGSALRLYSLIALLLGAPLAHAQAHEPALNIEGSDACFVETALRARVRHWLKAERVRASNLRVRVDVVARPLAFQLERDGVVVAERRFPLLPPACSERLDAVALAVALAIEHALREENTDTSARAGASASGESEAARAVSVPAAALDPGTATAPPAAPEPGATKAAAAEAPHLPEAPPLEAPKPAASERSAGPADEPEAQPALASDRSQAHPVGVRLGAGGQVLLEVLPDPALALDLGAELQIGERLHFGLYGLFAPSTNIGISTGNGYVETSLLGGRALGCVDSPPRTLAFEGCLGANGGVATARGHGFATAKTAHMTFVGALLRAGLRLALPARFSLRLAVDGLANAIRPKLEVSGLPARSAAIIGAAASIELLYALP